MRSPTPSRPDWLARLTGIILGWFSVRTAGLAQPQVSTWTQPRAVTFTYDATASHGSLRGLGSLKRITTYIYDAAPFRLPKQRAV